MWTKTRHKVITVLGRPIIAMLCKIRCHFKVGEKIRLTKGQPRLFLSNHSTAYDQFFMALSVNRPLYYMVSSVAFTPFVSKLLRFAVAPVERVKGKPDSVCIRNTYKIIKEGESFWIAPEGNRTLDGITGYISPSIVKLIRLLKIPVSFFVIEGGYGIQPRWANSVRKGKIKCYVKNTIDYEEYSKLSDDEFYSIICDNLYIKEQSLGNKYYSSKLAEGMEKFAYVCPHCNKITSFSTKGDVISCDICGLSARYLPDMTFQTLDGNPFAFKDTAEWYAFQREYVHNYSFLGLDVNTPLFYDDEIILLNNVPRRKLDKGTLIFYPNRMEFVGKKQSVVFDLDSTDSLCCTTIRARDVLTIHCSRESYLLKPSKKVNTFKYLHMFYHAKNLLNCVNCTAKNEFLGI
ncbi:MAG: lysophospholipid acyltransferase family protein [Clostridia bacterium]|nr:lysophospholipid acyltransferase family protein [Clostridia bacterium]